MASEGSCRNEEKSGMEVFTKEGGKGKKRRNGSIWKVVLPVNSRCLQLSLRGDSQQSA